MAPTGGAWDNQFEKRRSDDVLTTKKVISVMSTAALTVGCLDPGNQAPVLVATALGVSGPSAVTITAGSRRPVRLRALATSEDMLPVVRARVNWQSPGLDLTLSDGASYSDGNGVAQIFVSAGTTPGTFDVVADLADAEASVLFQVTVTPPPQIGTVTPSTFSGGDVVTVDGTGLGTAPDFEIGDAPASVVGHPTVNTWELRVPPCLAAGPTSVRAVVGGSPSNDMLGVYTIDDAIDLEVGAYVALASDRVAECARFPASGSAGARYVVAAQNLSATSNVQLNFRLAVGPETTPEIMLAQSIGQKSVADVFHDHLRQLEQDLPVPSGAPYRSDNLTTNTAAVEKGERRTFVVCATLTCSRSRDFTTVTAKARFVGQHASIFVDEDAPTGGFSDGDLADFGALFDQVLYDVDTDAFGAESDVDGNGVVVILLTPVVNALTRPPTCESSFVTGFFFAADISPNFQNDSRSNQAEVFYGLVPDPAGAVSCAHSVQEIRQLIPVTFVHEFQHMISYHQKVLLRGAGGAEVLWLNEGMSHLAEELAALRFQELGNDTEFSRFGVGNFVNLYDYLASPSSHSLVASAGTGSLAERGAAWSFLRWVVDQFGTDVTRRLTESGFVGTLNIEAAIGEPFERLVTEWFLANWTSDLPTFAPTKRLRYDTWSFRTTFGSLNSQSPALFPEPFPIIPITFTGASPFSAMGTLAPMTGTFFVLDQPGNHVPISVMFTQQNGAPFPGGTGAALSIVRVQ